MEGRTESNDPILKMDRITKLYPGTIALLNASLKLLPGEVHGVIGKNGAGKSTLVKIISGIISPTSGSIDIRGFVHRSLTRSEARHNRIAIVTQEPQIIPDFSVAENLFTPAYPCTNVKSIKWNEIYSVAEDIFAKTGIDISPRARGSDLTVSEQQLVLAVKAFYLDQAEIVLLDEVTASLSERDEELLYNLIARQKRENKAIIYITHRMAEIVRICDRVTVLRDGRTVTTEEVSELDEAKLSSFITGKDFVSVFHAAEKSEQRVSPARANPILLSVEQLNKAGYYHEVSFELHEDEVLGLAGLRGSGRTEILKSISGILRPDSGSIRLGNIEGRFHDPSEALRHGIVYLPEDRDREGLIEVLSVRFNLSLCSLSFLKRGAFLDKKKEMSQVKELIDLLSIDAPSTENEARYLSGGNKQKVVVGKILSRKPKIFLLDEPTKGIDIATKGSILEMVRTTLRRGAGVLITSPGLEDLLAVCDRIIVLHQGRIVCEYLRESFDESRIYVAMQGVAEAPNHKHGV
jgi:ABC-type sugar transport system ATPase subunit